MEVPARINLPFQTQLLNKSKILDPAYPRCLTTSNPTYWFFVYFGGPGLTTFHGYSLIINYKKYAFLFNCFFRKTRF